MDNPTNQTLHAAPGPSSTYRAGDKRPSGRGTAFYPRKRANTACQVCRARKTKCDNKKPSCSYCASVGVACVQSSGDISSFDPASLKILERLDHVESLLTGLTRQRAEESALLISLPYREEEAGGGRSSLRTVDEHETPLRSILPEKVEEILRWPEFRQIQAAYATSPGGVESPFPSTASQAHGNGRSLTELTEMGPLEMTRLLDNFFCYVHCKNPILDEVKTRRIVRRILLDGIDWTAESCLTMLILALGCVSGPFGASHDISVGTQPYEDSRVFFQAAQKRIGMLLATPAVIGAQCLFLSGVYMMTVFQPVFAWRFFSHSLAACQHFPFLTRAQSAATHFAGPSSTELEMGPRDTHEQAVYWSAWKSERELRFDLSLPDFSSTTAVAGSGANSNLYPPFFPAPPDEMHAVSGAEPTLADQRAKASWLFYLAEISLRRLSSRLNSEIATLHQQHLNQPSCFLEALNDLTSEYETQAREWAANLPEEFAINIDEAQVRPEIIPENVCRFVLRGHLDNLFELIYWPSVMAVLDAERVVSETTKNTAFRGLETHVRRLRLDEAGFEHRHHGTFFMIKSCTRSALVLLSAAKAGVKMPSGWEGAVLRANGLLSYWCGQMSDLGVWKLTIEQSFGAGANSPIQQRFGY